MKRLGGKAERDPSPARWRQITPRRPGRGLELTESSASSQLCRKSAGAEGSDTEHLLREMHFPDWVTLFPAVPCGAGHGHTGSLRFRKPQGNFQNGRSATPSLELIRTGLTLGHFLPFKQHPIPSCPHTDFQKAIVSVFVKWLCTSHANVHWQCGP